jgi:tetratricopeptide (TPR) repeat protein
MGAISRANVTSPGTTGGAACPTSPQTRPTATNASTPIDVMRRRLPSLTFIPPPVAVFSVPVHTSLTLRALLLGNVVAAALYFSENLPRFDGYLPFASTARRPTFTKDVAPILYARCVTCHQPDGDAPFSLVTYDEVRRRATLIAGVTSRRYMPPWKPDLDSPLFVADRRLRDDEIEVISRWAKSGAPEGRFEDLPASPRLASGWQWGEPDLVLTMPAYTLPADGRDVFRNFVITVPGRPGRDDRWVRALQFRPRSRGVHHANIRIDPTPASRALDEADPAPGYEGVILHSADYPDGHFLGWTPGQAEPPSSELAWKLTGGTDLVVQLHMRPTGRVERVAPLLGLYLTTAPPARSPVIVRLGRQSLDIPAGEPAFRVTDSFTLPAAARIVAVQAHAHYRARDVVAVATLPDRSRRVLLHVSDWDFRWQDRYRLADPIPLPAGSVLEATYTFDNSVRNARNPTRPPERASWGWRSSDEMGDVWFQMLTSRDSDRRMLVEQARRKMTEEDAIGSEVLIAREPNHVNLRNDAALIYRELGRFDRALEHFAAVTRLEPGSPAARYNEAVTLEAMGRAEDARTRYSEALRLDPRYALAHNALGNMLSRTGHADEAMTEYRAAIRADATLAIAHCSLARSLTETGQPAEAVAEYQAALAAEPDSLACLINFSWLLSAHRDAAIRRPAAAVQLGERAVALTHRSSAAALDALANAYAAAGRFEDAVSTGAEALRLLEPGASNAAAEDIRARLNLYRRRTAFVVPEK